MNITDVFSAKAVALVVENAASNKIPYLGSALFPAKKKMGLDLKYIVGAKGLPVSLKPSAFDAVSTIRSREGIKLMDTKMAYFKESMIVKEEDEQEILRIKDSTDPYAAEVLNRIFDDATTLVEGADVVPERMIMQLLASNGGHPSISIQADGATYAYNYDPDNEYSTNNYVALSGTSMWSDTTNSDPLHDVEAGLDAVEARTGVRPSKMIVSKQTMNYLKQNAKVRNYILAQNATATVMVTDARVKDIFAQELGVAIIVYTKQYKNESGTAAKFYPDGFATLIPDGTLGNTWYGTTPSERTGMKNPDAQVKIVNTGVAVEVTFPTDPDQTKTTVSEIVLPSFERIAETYTIKAY